MRRSLVLFCACSLFAGLIAPAGAAIEKIMNLCNSKMCHLRSPLS
jgi:hypothetical protein